MNASVRLLCATEIRIDAPGARSVVAALNASDAAAVMPPPAWSASARGLVGDGRYASLSAVVQRGLDLLREEIESKEAERVALRTLMRERADGSFVTLDEGSRDTEALLAAKRRAHGL